MKDINARKESIKILEENTGSNLFNLSHSKLLPRNTAKGKGSEGKNELLGLHQDQKAFAQQRKQLTKPKDN